MLDQDKNFLLISLIILITCLLDNVWISWGEVVSQSLLTSIKVEVVILIPHQILVLYLIYKMCSSYRRDLTIRSWDVKGI